MSTIIQGLVSQQANPVSGQHARPGIITAICILRWIGVAITFAFVGSLSSSRVSEISNEFGSWFFPYMTIEAIATIAICCGLWTMKRWAAYAFLFQTVLGVVIMLLLNRFEPVAIGASVCFTCFVMKHSAAMD